MGVGSPCPHVRNNIVTPHHLFLLEFCDILQFLINHSFQIILDCFTATSKEDLLKSIVPPALEDISDVKVEPKDNPKAKNNHQFVITVIPKLCQHNIPLIKSRFALVS